jgi:hypothetical protein
LADEPLNDPPAPPSDVGAAPPPDVVHDPDVGDAQATRDVEAMLQQHKPDVPPADPPEDRGRDRRPDPASWPWVVLGVVLGMVVLASLALWKARRENPPSR